MLDNSAKNAQFDGVLLTKEYTPLSKEEELALANASNNGDELALKKIIIAYTPFSNKIAGKYYRKHGGDVRDYKNQAVIGVIKALKKFDPEKGFRFSTFARAYIKGELNNYVMRNNNMVKNGTTKRQKSMFSSLGRATADLMNKSPDADRYTIDCQLAEIYKVTAKDVSEMRVRMQSDVSLDVNLSGSNNDGEKKFIDTLVDDSIEIEERLNIKSMFQVFNRAVQNLSTKKYGGLSVTDKSVIFYRRIKGKTLEETAILVAGDKKKPVSQERIRQIEVAALQKIMKEVSAITGMRLNDESLFVKYNTKRQTETPKVSRKSLVPAG